MNRRPTRREFLEFMGKLSLATAGTTALSRCSSVQPLISNKRASLPFSPVDTNTADELRLASGIESRVLISWGTIINGKKERFGFNNDFIAFIPMREGVRDEGLLWVNHESFEPEVTSGWTKGKTRSKRDVDLEMNEVGGSILHVQIKDGVWSVLLDSKFNRRITAHTPIPLVAPRDIEGSRVAIGTLANCAGGVTPWRTVLTCEENFHNFYGDHVYGGEASRTWVPGPAYSHWRDIYSHPPEHYGWVVEVDPFTGRSKKLTALGRFSHECATTIKAKDGRVIVYSGDDQNDECLYKFISSRPDSLEEGELFVANIEKGEWLSLNFNKNPEFKKRFKDQTELLVRAREAARIVGASLLDRPEDVEIDPNSGSVFVTLTNNKKKKNYHGSILKIVEDNGDHGALRFKASTFLAGGPETGFSSPDNMVFDRKGNLWMCNDVSGSQIDKGPFAGLGNNGLYYIPLSGPDAGQAFRVATGPRGAELTGPCFSPDGRTLFLSVQHPGEGSEDFRNPRSHWPEGGGSMPKPSVVTLQGPTLDALVL